MCFGSRLEKKDMAEGLPPHIRYRSHVVIEQLARTGFNAVCNTNEQGKHFIVIGTKD